MSERCQWGLADGPIHQCPEMTPDETSPDHRSKLGHLCVAHARMARARRDANKPRQRRLTEPCARCGAAVGAPCVALSNIWGPAGKPIKAPHIIAAEGAQ